MNFTNKGGIDLESSKCDGTKVTGASFTLFSMSDDFVDVILGALGAVDSSKVWMETDDVSTTVRGKTVHVFDVTKAICLHAAKTGKHVAFQATYGMGCPGDVETDAYLALNDAPSNLVNVAKDNLFAAAKFALYPLGGGNYIETILNQIESMKEYVEVSKTYYSTKLTGGLIDIFNGLENAFQSTIDAGSTHTVMTVTISLNSPSHDK